MDLLGLSRQQRLRYRKREQAELKLCSARGRRPRARGQRRGGRSEQGQGPPHLLGNGARRARAVQCTTPISDATFGARFRRFMALNGLEIAGRAASHRPLGRLGLSQHVGSRPRGDRLVPLGRRAREAAQED
eukprot:scaffold11250_cov101-Isochrysis_galbana.AAC.2